MGRSKIFICTLTLAFGAWFANSGLDPLRWLDRNLFGEALKDGLGRFVYEEDWGSVAKLPTRLDYSWLPDASRPILVAHALGEASGPGENSLAALHRSLQLGVRLLEIDIWLDERNILRCHHGPAVPAPFAVGDCTLPAALHAADEQGAWLILDIKTDFKATGEQIVKQLSSDPAIVRAVFQLYRPGDVDAFTDWSSQLPLPGPIVTAYRARRSVQHLEVHAARIGVRVLTIPLERAPALKVLHPSLALLVHPIHSCESARLAMQFPVAGMYVRSDVFAPIRQGCYQ